MIGRLRAWLSSLWKLHRPYAMDTTGISDDVTRLELLITEWEAITGQTLRKAK